MEFKVGDKVRIKSDDVSPLSSAYKKGDTAVYLGDGRFEMYTGTGQSVDDERSQERIFEKIVRGRPSKPKTLKFVAIFDEEDGDPHKLFFTKKELNEWLTEAREDDNIVWNSIKVIEAKRVYDVWTSFKLKERK